MSELEASGEGDQPPPYIIFVVVFLFFITGLLGFLICHLLKKKGYRCRTGDIEDEEEEEELGVNAEDDDEENQDTVEQILKCIIENEANMEAFNEMIANHNVCVRHDPRLRKESLGGVPPHLHTVHSGTDHNSCLLCAQVKSKKGRRHSRTPRFKQRPGEQTVFSVGRFRVTHTDKKLHGGPNPLVSSGDQLDQSQDSDERKGSEYNLRSMFKDVRPPSESTNGLAPSVGKRRKSLTIFGLRRGSDPLSVRAGEGAGVRFAIQQQPAVLEELSQGEDRGVPSGHETKAGNEPEKERLKSPRPVPTNKAKTSEGASPPPPGKNQASDSKASRPPSVPGQTAGTAGKPRELEVKLLEAEEGYHPGPLQTSTPIAPMYGSLIPADQAESYHGTDYPVTQTPPDPSSSPDLEPGVGANLTLISLGSSPPSSQPIRTHSSVSSLKTPTSPLANTPSPKLGSRTSISEASKTGLTPTLTPSPKLPSGHPSPSFGLSASPSQVQTLPPDLTASPNLDTMPVSSQTSSSHADHDHSFEHSPRLTKREAGSRPFPREEEGPVGTTSLRTEKEIKRVGILKKAKPLPVQGVSKESVHSSPSEQLSEDRPASLLLSPSSPVSPAQPRIGGMTIVKASPGSKREFSVVTMVETEEACTLTKDQEVETGELEDESERLGINSAVDLGREVPAPGVGDPGEQSGGVPEAELQPAVGPGRDDMVEMEDIRDCKAIQKQ